MKDIPILMTGENVRAILEGRKAQTRRIIKPQPHEDVGEIIVGIYNPTKTDRHGEEYPGSPVFGAYNEYGDWGLKCPYGKPGDRLWVRENWRVVGKHTDSTKPIEIGCNKSHYIIAHEASITWNKDIYGKLRSNIHMPKSLCRLWLEVISVRAERLQKISVEDAKAEGCNSSWLIYQKGNSKHNARREKIYAQYGIPVADGVTADELSEFAYLWDSINAKPKLCKHNPYTNTKEICYVGYPWEDIRRGKKLPSGKIEYIVGNPMVWPIEFMRIKL